VSARRLLTTGLTLVIVLAVAVGAWAYFGSTGTGTGSGSASVTAQPVTISSATATSSLIPTGTATGDVNASINNPNSFSVHIAQITLDTGASLGTNGFSANAANCALSFAPQDNGGAGWTLPAGDTSIDLSNSLTMGTTADNSCQGQTFTVYLAGS
jgi:hypothetical protein